MKTGGTALFYLFRDQDLGISNPLNDNPAPPFESRLIYAFIAEDPDGDMVMRADGDSAPAGQDARALAYRLDDQIGFVMRLANQRHTALFATLMIEGLTPPQFGMLARLRELGPCSPQRLGRLLHLDLPTVKGVIDRLMGRGFVLSAQDPQDRRRRAVGLTERGLAVADAAIDAGRDITTRTLAPLSAEESEQLIALLRKLT